MYLTEPEAAAHLKLASTTLRDWRFRQQGPRFIKLGKGKNSPVRYRLTDLEKFAEQGVCDAIA